MHSVWELASSVTAKIDEIKMAKVGSEQHADCTAEAKRIFDEMDNAVNWLETTDAEKVVKFIQPYRRVWNYGWSSRNLNVKHFGTSNLCSNVGIIGQVFPFVLNLTDTYLLGHKRLIVRPYKVADFCIRRKMIFLLSLLLVAAAVSETNKKYSETEKVNL